MELSAFLACLWLPLLLGTEAAVLFEAPDPKALKPTGKRQAWESRLTVPLATLPRWPCH